MNLRFKHPKSRSGSSRINTIREDTERQFSPIWVLDELRHPAQSSRTQSTTFTRSWTRSRTPPPLASSLSYCFPLIFEAKPGFLKNIDILGGCASGSKMLHFCPQILLLFDHLLRHPENLETTKQIQAPRHSPLLRLPGKKATTPIFLLDEASERWLHHCANSVCFCNVVMGNSGGWDNSNSKVKIRAAWPTGP